MKAKIFEDLKQAMRDKNTLAKGVLQILKSNLDLAEKEKGDLLTGAESLAVLQKEVKQINQSIEGAKKAGRDDIITQENAKLSIVESYMPEMMDFDAIIPVLSKLGVRKGMNMGDAMKLAKEYLTGKADNATISKAVKSLIVG